MPDKKKTAKLPPGTSQELKASEGVRKTWSETADSVAQRLANSEWRSHTERPFTRGEGGTGYFVLVHWYHREKVWQPLYLHRGHVASQLNRLFNSGQSPPTPISKYLSSFPRSQRKLLWIKWVMDAPGERNEAVPFQEVLQAFSGRYNQGESLAFNMDDVQPDVPDNFSLLDY